MRVFVIHHRSLQILFACLLLGGCYFLQPVSEPIPAQHFKSGTAATGLVVLMPGFGDGPQQFIDNGFIETVQQVNPSFDVIAVNAHYGYYRNYSVVERLHRDVIEPSRARYAEIWLVGISMGGFGAAAYSSTYPQNIEGLILLAPFMGPKEVVEEVMAAGKLGEWVPPDLATIEDDKQRKFYQVWQFYREYVEAPQRKPRLYLGYSDQDHLHEANAYVAKVLESENSLVLPGGHKWIVWKPLFAELANRAIGSQQGKERIRTKNGGHKL